MLKNLPSSPTEFQGRRAAIEAARFVRGNDSTQDYESATQPLVGSTRFRLIGPLEITVDGRSVLPPKGTARTVLIALLIHGERGVTLRKLAEWVWDGDAPEHRDQRLQAYVYRLRVILNKAGFDSDLIQTTPHGYRIRSAPGVVDFHLFSELLDAARATLDEDDRRGAADLLRIAISLWHDPPVPDIISEPARAGVVTELTDRYLRATGQRIELELQLGRHDELVSELRGLTRRFPLREEFWAQLMCALHRSDRRGDALIAYREISRILSEELGIGPGHLLTDCYRMIMRDAAPERPRRNAPSTRTRPPVALPHLPPPPVSLVGRERDLAAITAVVDAASATVPVGPAPRVSVVAITGPGGIGKTALALRWAHTNREFYPDGVLFLDLAGSSPHGGAARPAAAADSALGALGVTLEESMSTAERIAYFRELVARKRMLVILDDAAAAQQTSPLLPETGNCTVLITSQHHLSSLHSAARAFVHTVQPLDVEDGYRLLVDRIGEPPTTVDRFAIERVSGYCAGVAAALHAAADRLLATPRSRPAELADELSDPDAKLDALQVVGQPSLRGVLAGRLVSLPGPVRELFELLSVLPTRDFSSTVAAALCDRPVKVVRYQLHVLESVHFVAITEMNRYRIPELARCVAAERLRSSYPGEMVDDAMDRVVDYYLRVGQRAIRLTRDTSVATEQGVDKWAALNWLCQERPGIDRIHEWARSRCDRHKVELLRRVLSSWPSQLLPSGPVDSNIDCAGQADAMRLPIASEHR